MFSRNQFVWNEPWFFTWRIRPWRGWCVVVAILIVIAALTAAALVFLTPQRPPWHQVIGLSLAIAAVGWVIFDGPNWRRRVTLDAKSLDVVGDLGQFTQHESYSIDKIEIAVIRRAEELGWPFAALILQIDGEQQIIGIDHGISLSRLAAVLYEREIPVGLDDWDPQAGNEFERTFQLSAADPASVQPTGRIDTLPQGTLRLWTPLGIAVAIFKQCWAGAIAVGVIIAAGVVIYRNWGNLGLVQVVLAIGIPIAVLYIAGVYTDRFATASTSKSLTKDAKAQIRRRPHVELNVDSSDIHPVEIFREDQFAKLVQKIHEMGFVEVDLLRRELKFEGKQERWKLPAACLRQMFIEEVQTGAEGDPSAGQKNYYIVIEFDLPSQQEKFGIRSARRDFGDYNDIKRAEQAIELFEYIAGLLEPAA